MTVDLDVAGLGYNSYDLLAIVSCLPDFDDVQGAHVNDLVFDGGGPVGTALTALARLGARTAYIGLMGEDREGRWLEEQFEASGVSTDHMRFSDKVGTNVCLVLVEAGTGRRSILCRRGVQPQDLKLDTADRKAIQRARVLHLDGQFMPAAIRAATWMRNAGGKVCLDGNHPRPGLPELLPLVDWLVVAEPFPEAYTGLVDLNAAAAELLALGPEVLVVTLGEKGCQLWAGDERLTMAGCAVEVVDTTGAGDAFHGGFVYAMLQGWNLDRVARFANAVAALNCLVLGGRRGLPTLAQVENLLG
jgi:sugar/nucleoside kinase (ribokinase family)